MKTACILSVIAAVAISMLVLANFTRANLTKWQSPDMHQAKSRCIGDCGIKEHCGCIARKPNPETGCNCANFGQCTLEEIESCKVQ
ncbi:MAG: hypothetical protein ABIG10_02920 [bacterium]